MTLWRDEPGRWYVWPWHGLMLQVDDAQGPTILFGEQLDYEAIADDCEEMSTAPRWVERDIAHAEAGDARHKDVER